MIGDFLLIDSIDIGDLTDRYRLFFAGLLPGVFMAALIAEHFTGMDPAGLLKRAILSVLLLSSVGTFYHQGVRASMDAADGMLRSEMAGNPLLGDMLSGNIRSSVAAPSAAGKKFFAEGYLKGTMDFLRYHLFKRPVNDLFTTTVAFVTGVCLVVLKIVYSLVYWLGLALFGLPCLIHLFPGMGKVLRGALTSWLWCLALPHVLVVVLTVLCDRIGHGYAAGEVIGGSIAGTALLFVMALMIAFVPLITTFILTGGGVSHAGGVVATMGANLVMNMPKLALTKAARHFFPKITGRAGIPVAGATRTSYRTGRKGRKHFNQISKGGKYHEA